MLTDKTKIVETSLCNNFERILNRDVIEANLAKHFIIDSNYTTITISDDGIVDVDGSIELSYNDFNNIGLTELSIQFGYVKDWFGVEFTNIKSLKGFPHTVDGNCFLNNCKKLKSLEFSPKCKELYCRSCESLESLNGLNCEKFYGNYLNLKRFGTNFNAKYFEFTQFPTPTSDEMRYFIKLNPLFRTNQKDPWIKLIKDYHKHKDIFRAISEFEALYNEPYLIQNETIDIIDKSDIFNF